MKTAWIVLEDGTVMKGRAAGAIGESSGEMVFNTALAGYQEVITDPSYCGQIVTMTYPMIGNYGIVPSDHESKRPFLRGLVVRELCRYPSNFESTESVDNYLRRHGICAIEGVDTRALTLRLREKGSLRAILSSSAENPKELLRRVKKVPSMVGQDLASEVTCEAPYDWTEGLPVAPEAWPLKFPHSPRVVVMDFGVKYGILRHLVSLGCSVTVVPARTSAKEILALSPDGILLSNGPGDPEPVSYAIETVRQLAASRVPILGICLGHQILGLALGGKSFKLKFGHHGANHPVMDVRTSKVEITSQNHGFCLDLDSLPPEVRTTHINLNDKTSEGLEHTELPIFSVQYHPESCPGPHDSQYLFERFGERLLKRLGVNRPQEAR